jgi:hypothetical protein
MLFLDEESSISEKTKLSAVVNHTLCGEAKLKNGLAVNDLGWVCRMNGDSSCER